VTTNGLLIVLMGFLFLFLGYMGVPVAFALIASVLLVTVFTPVSQASMIAQVASWQWSMARPAMSPSAGCFLAALCRDYSLASG
jgi:multisubunit Na+/H+ antiporter MnhG subunit